MSRAFVREDDQAAAVLPQRAVSEHPNFVTAAGLAQLEARVRDLEGQLQVARAASDADLIARIGRDLRYFAQRRGTARLVDAADRPTVVRFGVQVVLRLPDGSERRVRLVGEDEADPAAGLISWVSPLSQALLGLAPGDSVPFAGGQAQIVAVQP